MPSSPPDAFLPLMLHTNVYIYIYIYIYIYTRLSCSEDDTIGDLKKMVAAQTGTRPDKIRIQKWYTVYKDHITLDDYEVHDGMNLVRATTH